MEKKDIYTDTRDDGNKEETNENWTEEKLRQVVEAKMGKDAAGQEANSKGKDTQQRYDIVCKREWTHAGGIATTLGIEVADTGPISQISSMLSRAGTTAG